MIRRGRVGLSLIAVALSACSVDPGTDRTGTLVAGIQVDSVRFLPIGSRFVLRDSATSIAFLGYHAGYVCSRLLRLGLADAPGGVPPAYRPETQVRLPASDECALDSGARDTTASRVFSIADDTLRLANPAGKVTDSALLVSGRLEKDSLRGVPDSNGTFTVGKLAYAKSDSASGPVLTADSVPACIYLNSAEWEKGKGDTLTVRYTWLFLDPADSPDSCQGPTHDEVLTILPRRFLRMNGPSAAQ
jgi:hypothetical protein